MSFANSLYYKPLIDTLINDYCNNQSNFTEEKIRDIYSRVYYTIFLYCRDTLEIENNDYLSSHKHVISSIPNKYTKKVLRRLQQLRVKADYHNDAFSKSYREVISIQRDMNNILSFSKEQLKTS